MTGFRTNVGARVGGRPGLFTAGGHSADDPVWATGSETTFPRWEVFRDEWGWTLTGWTDATTFVEFRLSPPTADLDYEGPNTFYLEWSSDGLWETPTSLTVGLISSDYGVVFDAVVVRSVVLTTSLSG